MSLNTLFWYSMHDKKCKAAEAEVAPHEELDQWPQRCSTWTGAGHGSAIQQLKKVGDVVIQMAQNWMWHTKVPPSQLVHKMAPLKPEGHARDTPKKCVTKKKAKVAELVQFWSSYPRLTVVIQVYRLTPGNQLSPQMKIPSFGHVMIPLTLDSSPLARLGPLTNGLHSPSKSFNLSWSTEMSNLTTFSKVRQNTCVWLPCNGQIHPPGCIGIKTFLAHDINT